MSSHLILASKSPRRSELLRQIGIEFEVVPAGVSEDFILGESPQEHVIRLAQTKAEDVSGNYPERWVVAADTVVCINDSVLGKPRDQKEAMQMLRRLSGQEHWVWTGFAVCHLAKRKDGKGAVQTAVKMKELTPEEVEWYVRTEEPYDKAGGYAIQGLGSFMIESIRGSYTNVVGLPVCELVQMLQRLGAITIAECGMRIAP